MNKREFLAGLEQLQHQAEQLHRTARLSAKRKHLTAEDMPITPGMALEARRRLLGVLRFSVDFLDGLETVVKGGVQ